MPTYRVNGTITVSCTTLVEADSADDAKKIAESRDVAGLSVVALYPDEDEAWHIDTDGEPEITGVNEE